MDRLTPKRAAAERAAAPERKAFKEIFPLCMVCGENLSIDVHEIVRGTSRCMAVLDRRTWLAVCRPCHELLDDYEKFPVALQYVIKAIWDAEYFDRVGLNTLRDRAVNAIDEADMVRSFTLRILKG